MTTRVKTPGRHGYAVEFSPFNPNQLACATGENFGISGGGSLFIIEQAATGAGVTARADWSDVLFDVTWSENNAHIVVTAGGDGSVQVWDLNMLQAPVQVKKEHEKEVHSVDWSLTRDLQLLLSSSWDGKIKLWDIERPGSLTTFTGHEGMVYSAVWSPLIPGGFASVAGDGTVRVWDVKKPYMPQVVIPAHDSEVLTCDWSKYDQNILITGAVDCSLKVWDLRNPRAAVCTLLGHSYAIRKVKCSPFHGTSFASCSYDLTVRFWDWAVHQVPVETVEHHSEFVCGVDYNLHVPGQIADCSWDQSVMLYYPRCLQPTSPTVPATAPHDVQQGPILPPRPNSSTKS